MKRVLIILIVGALMAVLFGVYEYNRPHKSLTNQTPDFSMSSMELLSDYQTDESDSDKKYLNKIIQVNGLLREVQVDHMNEISLVLEAGEEMSAVICEMEKGVYKESDFTEGDQVSIKGICTGMLMDVVLVQCSLTN